VVSVETSRSGIEAEHVRYTHRRICVMLALVFDAMMIHGVVPSMFGLGITIPLLKGNSLDGSLTGNSECSCLRCVF